MVEVSEREEGDLTPTHSALTTGSGLELVPTSPVADDITVALLRPICEHITLKLRSYRQSQVIMCEIYLYSSSGYLLSNVFRKKRKEIFYLTTHSTHFFYGYYGKGPLRYRERKPDASTT